MATIAKGMITLSSVNDAFSVSLNPNSCVINADWDGSNPRLDNAYTDIRVYRGDVAVEFSQPVILGYSNNAVTASVTKIDNQTWRIKFATIDTSSLNGKVNLKIVVGSEFATTVSFGYTVVRETSMLDWILDWEGREKTEIAGEHIITPKIFVGKSENGGQLTGTYIGPAFDGSGRTGVFGYSAGVEIFHLDNTGGMIGGWQITTGGITTADGNLKILSEGSIISAPGGTLAWELKKDGSATFAKGNVKFSANGDAEFAGKITSKSGAIGGWNITHNQLNSNRVIIDSKEGFIGINASPLQALDVFTGDLVFPDIPDGGVKMWYSSANDFGFAGWSSSKLVFQLGSINQIAGWKFDDTSLWLGIKNNTARQNTVNANSITLGTSGLRGKNWYIDTDGEISFVGGLIHFTANGGTICGWTLTSDHLAANKSALVSASGYVGLYLSSKALPEAVSSYETHIRQNGGIYLNNGPVGPYLRGNTTDGKMIFQLCSGVSYIGGWNFSNSCLFTGAAPADVGSFATQDNITLSPDGLRGYKFRLEANGSGAIAGGNISWNEAGDITFVGTKMKWAGTNTTIIDANGIFTGKISADNITAGTISTASIKCEGKWALNTDGSGYLASNHISWLADGTLSVKGHIEANSGVIGGFKITDSGIFSQETNYYTGDVKNGAFSMFSQGSLAYLCFHDDGRWAGIGLNCSPAAGTPTVACFESYYTDSIFPGWNTNIALYLRAENAGHNFAYLGKGNGVLNGFIAGIKLSKYVMTAANTIYQGFIKPSENNKWLLKATADDCGMQLPEVGEVRNAIGMDTNDAWAIEFEIFADIESKKFNIYGKYLRVIGNSPNQTIPWFHDGDPILINQNGARIDSIALAAGDSVRIMLIYDPDQTKTETGSITRNGKKETVTWSYKYTARIVNNHA